MGHVDEQDPSAERESDLAASGSYDVRWCSAALPWLTTTSKCLLSRLPVGKEPCVGYVCICTPLQLAHQTEEAILVTEPFLRHFCPKSGTQLEQLWRGVSESDGNVDTICGVTDLFILFMLLLFISVGVNSIII